MAWPSPQGPHTPGGSHLESASTAQDRQAAFQRVPATLEELDAHNAAFLDHATYELEHSVQTVRSYHAAYANFRHFLLDPVSAEIPWPDRAWAIGAWKVWNQKRGIKRISTNQYWRMLKPFFKYLSAQTGRPNPFLGVKPPGIPRAEDRVPKALDLPQLQRVLDAARHYMWRTALQRERAVALIGVMLFAGLRKGEVLRLKYGHVSLHDGTITIEDSKGRFGKSRVVMIPSPLRVILARYIAVRNARLRRGADGKPVGAPAAFFISKNNRALSESQFRRIVKIVRLSAGVPLFAHALRHSYISLLFRSKAAPHVVQELAGHRDLQTTQRYLQCFDDEKHRAVARLSRLLR